MNKIEIILPAMGEGIIEATITKWFVTEGSYIEKDTPLVEVATDKVDSEISAPASGFISKIIYKEGQTPKTGEILAVMDVRDNISEKEHEESLNIGLSHQPIKSSFQEEIVIQASLSSNKNLTTNTGNQNSSPLIRHLAKNRGISFQELIRIQGSGSNDLITREDLYSYIRDGRESDKSVSLEEEQRNSEHLIRKNIDYPTNEDEKRIKMDRTRKLIASHMVLSKRVAPHVTSMIEVDVTHLVLWQKAVREIFHQKYNVKLTYTPVIALAVVKALADFPGINVSVEEDYILYKKNINIGIATALPDGNLIVPVIKKAQELSFVELVLRMNSLATKSRNGTLDHSDIKGGTFTITNMGPYENVMGIPIINQPESGILAVGVIKKKPAVVRTGDEETIGIREIMILSLTYDHRVIDGALGGSFLKTIGNYLLERPPIF